MLLRSECTICGAKRKFKSLMYDEALLPYCASPMQCTPNHPNSPSNCKIRGTFISMKTHEEAVFVQKQRTEHTYEQTAQMFGKKIQNVSMNKLVSGAISFRVQHETQADYIGYLLAKLGTSRITDTLHYILNKAIEADTSFLAQYAANRGTYAATPNIAFDVEQTSAPESAPEPRERLQTHPTRKMEPDEGVFTF